MTIALKTGMLKQQLGQFFEMVVIVYPLSTTQGHPTSASNVGSVLSCAQVCSFVD